MYFSQFVFHSKVNSFIQISTLIKISRDELGKERRESSFFLIFTKEKIFIFLIETKDRAMKIKKFLEIIPSIIFPYFSLYKHREAQRINIARKNSILNQY